MAGSIKIHYTVPAEATPYREKEARPGLLSSLFFYRYGYYPYHDKLSLVNPLKKNYFLSNRIIQKRKVPAHPGLCNPRRDFRLKFFPEKAKADILSRLFSARLSLLLLCLLPADPRRIFLFRT